MTEPTAPDMARMINRAKKTAKIHDAFLRRLCFPCYRAIDPENDGPETPARHIWIGSAPMFLTILLCGAHYRQFLANSYTEDDAHTWPVLHAPLDE